MRNVFANLDWSVLTNALISIIPALICVSFHEMSHAAAAYALGDPTAKNAKRLTMNPIRHIDVFGLLMMAVFGFGWAKGVPINMRNFKNQRLGMALSSLAGPASNMVLAAFFCAVTGVVIGLFPEMPADNLAAEMLVRTIYLSIALGIFNLIPIPPLDGSKVLFSLLPEAAYAKLMRIERFGFIVLLLLVNTAAFSGTVGAATMWIFERMFKITYAVGGLFA
ncbi:MAG: site-2 protease family protein [Oscillospiraceae bacterium]|nr:site-2 protease family protein [Oscillospiraceae bacterium]